MWWLNTGGSGLVYSLQVFLMHVGGSIQVPRYFLTKDSLSMQLGTFFSQGGLCHIPYD